MTTAAATATLCPCPCVASKIVQCTEHVRDVVTVEQAAELDGLFMRWLDTRDGLAAEDKIRRLRAANWKSCPRGLFDLSRTMLESWLA